MNIKIIIEQEYIKILDEDYNKYNHSEYLKWKRNNVTFRGVRELGSENSGFARFGDGLYTAHLSNKKMAREYGKVYFVVGARPKNPKKVRDTNQAEIFLYNDVIIPYLRKNKLKEDSRVFFEHTDIKTEMLNKGYDGLEVIGREVVNYTPNDNEIYYYENENQVIEHYKWKHDIR